MRRKNSGQSHITVKDHKGKNRSDLNNSLLQQFLSINTELLRWLVMATASDVETVSNDRLAIIYENEDVIVL